MDNVPADFVAGENYVSAVSADNYGNGVASAHLMAQALEGEGDIGIVFHDADFFVTRQRYDAFKQTIEENYPGITIAEEQGIVGPDFAGEAESRGLCVPDPQPRSRRHLGRLGRAGRGRHGRGPQRRP